MHPHHIRTLLAILLSAIASLPESRGAELIDDHVDVTFRYLTGTGVWEGFYNWGGTENNPTNETPFDLGALPARDRPDLPPLPPPDNGPDPDAGERFVQPPVSSFDFTGVPDGNPIWIYSQSDLGYTWPGMRSDQPSSGTFKIRTTGDSRAPSSQRWIKASLESVTYAGQSSNPHFSAWQIQSGSPVVWMSTFENGIDSTDCYYFTELSHTHLSWGFSALGIYRVSMRASAVLDSNSQTVQSDPFDVTFVIGTYANWIAQHYSGPALVDDTMSGPMSDSDEDNVTLLEEYAFNLLPKVPDRKELVPVTGTSGLPYPSVHPSGGSDRLHLEFLVRKTANNPQIVYTVQFNDTLDPGNWQDGGTIVSTNSIDDTWERVVVADPTSVSASTSGRRFARVVITLLDSITY
ncbi:MAG: TIGR03769 domain-containing protein [Verrucomicrobiota bacterium]